MTKAKWFVILNITLEFAASPGVSIAALKREIGYN
jgi:hypothetical protein